MFVLDEKKKVIESLSIFYTLPKEVQKQKKIMRNRYKIKNYSVEIEKTKGEICKIILPGTYSRKIFEPILKGFFNNTK